MSIQQEQEMIIDAFIFYNELDLLTLRFAELYDRVDWFVLVEATRTFRGDEKPLVFAENKDRYAQYLPKVIHVIVDDMPMHTDAWGREDHQRNAIRKGIEIIQPPDDAVLIISDADEIPDMGAIQTATIDRIYALEQDFYYYTPTWKHRERWLAARVLPIRVFRQHDSKANHIRMGISSVPGIPYAGWHFSYFGDISFIRKKIESFSHQEFNFEMFKNPQHLEDCIQNGRDVFFRPDKPLVYVPIHSNPYLPRTLTTMYVTNKS
jgi:hypothetical protein